MRTAAKVTLVSKAAMGCLAFATLAVGCGGSSGGGTGGNASIGGSASMGGVSAGGSTGAGGSIGAGGASSTGLNCAAAVEPGNGVVTDFSDWTSPKWGSSSALSGVIFGYSGTNGSKVSAAVEGTPKGLHLTGSVFPSDYSGGGLGFNACATVANFTKVQFDIAGPGAPGCDLEIQLQTFDQRPTTQTPPGGCDSAAGSCYAFPVVNKVVDVSTPITTPTTITKSLSDFSNWSAANAKQVVGIQWQFTGTNINSSVDGGATSCPIDVTIMNIKFLP